MGEARYFSQDEKLTMLEQQEYMCGSCGSDLWNEYATQNPAHHILPVWAGGDTELENGVVLCPNCHLIWDNRAVIGYFWPDNNLTDFDPVQIKDENRYFSALEKIYRNKQRGLKIK